MQAKSESWTTLKWQKTYNFKVENYRMASRSDKFIVGQFWNFVNPKDGFAFVDCKDIQAK